MTPFPVRNFMYAGLGRLGDQLRNTAARGVAHLARVRSTRAVEALSTPHNRQNAQEPASWTNEPVCVRAHGVRAPATISWASATIWLKWLSSRKLSA